MVLLSQYPMKRWRDFHPSKAAGRSSDRKIPNIYSLSYSLGSNAGKNVE
jgi:hypothetical protein